MLDLLKYFHLMKVFLTNSEAFNEPKISQFLLDLHTLYTHPFNNNNHDNHNNNNNEQSFLNFEKNVVSFYGFFKNFLETFVTASFGDPIFARFLFIFLRMDYRSEFRGSIFSELGPSLRIIEPKWIPYDNDKNKWNSRDEITEIWKCWSNEIPLGLNGYLFPVEKNATVLELFENALLSQKVTLENTPFLYWYSIHHIVGYIFGDEISWERKDMLRRLMSSLINEENSSQFENITWHILAYDVVGSVQQKNMDENRKRFIFDALSEMHDVKKKMDGLFASFQLGKRYK